MLFCSLLFTIVITLFAGYLGKFKIHSTRDFMLGSNVGLKSGTSMLMGSIIGGASTVGTAQMAFKRGVGAIWFILGLCIASIILSHLYSSYINKKNVYTLPQIIGVYYTQNGRKIASLFLALGMMVHINGQVISSAAILSAFCNNEFKLASFITILLLIIYSVFGGFWGGTFVGAIKTLLLYITSIICGFILIFNLSAISTIKSYFTINPWLNPFSEGFLSDASLLISTVVGILSTQTYFQTIISVKNVKTAKNVGYLTAFLVFPVGIVCTMIGMYMRATHPDIIPREAFFLFLKYYCNDIFSGITMATVLISSIATASGLALGISTLLVKDLIKEKNSIKELIYLRVILLAIGSISYFIVIFNENSMILNWGFISMVFRATPIFIPLIGSFYLKKQKKILDAKVVAIGPLVSLALLFFVKEKASVVYFGLIVSSIIFYVELKKLKKEIRKTKKNII